MGRIHRYDQREDCLIFNVVAANTIKGRVLERLLDKLQQIRDTLATPPCSTWWAKSRLPRRWSACCATTTPAGSAVRTWKTACLRDVDEPLPCRLPDRLDSTEIKCMMSPCSLTEGKLWTTVRP